MDMTNIKNMVMTNTKTNIKSMDMMSIKMNTKSMMVMKDTHMENMIRMFG